MFFIQHCFICLPSDSTVSEDAGIEPGAVATSALALTNSARYHPLVRSHPQTRSHPLMDECYPPSFLYFLPFPLSSLPLPYPFPPGPIPTPPAGWLKIKDAEIYNLLTMQDSSRVPEGDHKEI